MTNDEVRMSNANRKSSFVNRTSFPIGVFDSGLGGLTVVRALGRVMPHEAIVYFGDTARLPYGTKSAEVIRRFAAQDTRFLLSRNVKLVIVACHSASSVALDELKKHCPVPVIGVIDPGAQAAVRATRNNRIGVIGTNLTVSSGAYERAIRRYRQDVEIVAKATPLFVPLAEEGWLDNEAADAVAATYLKSFKTEEVDTLLLGCTHYPLLKKVIARVLGRRIALVDSSFETALTAQATLHRLGLDARRGRRGREKAHRRFYLSDLSPNFTAVCSRFLGEPVPEVVRATIAE